MIGVVVPCHNEEGLIGRCVTSLREAAEHPALDGEPVRLAFVLDACTDHTAIELGRVDAEVLKIDVRNVGVARAAGAARLLALGARWLAFTDADSAVRPDWLSAQLALHADAVCGCVEVDDWALHAPQLRSRYEARYRFADGHRHVHGANLGVSAAAYQRVGGMPSLRVGEDVAFVRALLESGARIAWSNRPRVATSSRLDGRAAGGFASFLQSLAVEAGNDPHGDIAA